MVHRWFGKMAVPILFIGGIGVAIFSCRHDSPEVVPCGNIPAVVSFKVDILPLFDTYCNYAGCHSGGSPPGHLNLVDSVAYSQLWKPGTGNVDIQNPTASVIYVSMTNAPKIMPPSGALDSCKTTLLLKWIQQGALNN